MINNQNLWDKGIGPAAAVISSPTTSSPSPTNFNPGALSGNEPAATPTPVSPDAAPEQPEQPQQNAALQAAQAELQRAQQQLQMAQFKHQQRISQAKANLKPGQVINENNYGTILMVRQWQEAVMRAQQKVQSLGGGM